MRKSLVVFFIAYIPVFIVVQWLIFKMEFDLKLIINSVGSSLLSTFFLWIFLHILKNKSKKAG